MLWNKFKSLFTYFSTGNIKKSNILIGFCVLAIAAIIGLTVHVERVERNALFRHEKLDSLQALLVIRSDIEVELNKSLIQLGALAAYISVNPDIAKEEFNVFTGNLLNQDSHITSMGAAPDMVVKYVYPYEENKTALGLDYRNSEGQWELAFLAKETRQQVMAGPLMSLQGKEVLIARSPVFLRQGVGKRDAGSFWGIVSVLIDAKELFEAVGLKNRRYDISMRGRDGRGRSGEVFYGNPVSFEADNVTLSIAVPGGSWQLVAASKTVIEAEPREIMAIRLISLFLCLFVITFTTFRLRYLKERQAERHKLEVALLDAEKANRAKSEFLANMSHELRTPLNAIIGFSDLITSVTGNQSGQDKVGEYASDINQSGHHLLKIINDILDLSKVESGNFTTTIETVYLQDTIEHTLRMMRNAITTGELQVINSIPDSLPPLQSDERMIKQIFFNLLSNAVKFTPAGGKITLTADVQPDRQIKITLTDSGVGMSEDDLVIALQAFGQTDSYLVRHSQGTGLGLSLVKAFVLLLDGEFNIQSEVDVGTEITLIFPL